MLTLRRLVIWRGSVASPVLRRRVASESSGERDHLANSHRHLAPQSPLCPEIPIALLSSKLRNLVSSARELGAIAIHPRRNMVSRALVAAAREAELRVHVWTVNDPAEVQAMLRVGVDAITSDNPERAVAIVGEGR